MATWDSELQPARTPDSLGSGGHAGMRGVRVWKDPHIRKEREMCGAPGNLAQNLSY